MAARIRIPLTRWWLSTPPLEVIGSPESEDSGGLRHELQTNYANAIFVPAHYIFQYAGFSSKGAAVHGHQSPHLNVMLGIFLAISLPFSLPSTTMAVARASLVVASAAMTEHETVSVTPRPVLGEMMWA